MMKRFNKTMNLVREGLQYSIVEGAYLVSLVVDIWHDGELTQWWLWVGAALAVVWSLATFTTEAKVEMKKLVMDRSVFLTDFFMSAFILTLIAIVVRNENLWIMGAILLATGQNLRYGYLSTHWLLEERREHRKEKGHTDNDMP